MAALPSAVQNLDDFDLIKRLIEFTPDAMLVVSGDGKIVLANSQAELLFAYSAKDMIGQSIEMLIPRRFRKQHKHYRHDFMGENRIRPMGTGLKISARCKDGTEISCAISLRNIHTPQGSFSIVTARAVPSRDELEDEIRETELDSRPFLELTNAIPWRADARTCQFTFIGLQVEEILGYGRQQWYEADFWPDHIHPEDRDFAIKYCEESARKFDQYEFEYRMLTADGRVVYLLDIVSVSKIEGVPATLQGFMIDVTDRRNGETVLRQAVYKGQQQKKQLERENAYLRQNIKTRFNYDEIIGDSKVLGETLKAVQQVAKTNSTVLIQGETGTGKELIARAIHNNSQRCEHTMVTVNCSALPASLVEAELFGREKGAYTGAMTRQAGRFELADGSTLFLDEIGDLSTEVQTKLLRVLQDGEFQRLGDSKTKKVDVRVIAATNHQLDNRVRDGEFREDLYYRLNVFPINVPPLRDRIDDIPQLVWAFIREFEAEMGKKIEFVSPETMEAFQQHDWPGNVRELKNSIERAIIWSDGSILQFDNMDLRRNSKYKDKPRSLNEVEHVHIESVLDSTRWRIRGVGGAAEILALKPTTLEARMKKLGITRPA
jgi:PAS domain S-box-containing protein